MSAVSIPQTGPGATALVIVGAGLAGWTTAREFRKLDASAPIVLVTADSGDFYAKPGLSNALAQNRTPQQLVSTPAARRVAAPMEMAGQWAGTAARARHAWSRS